MGGAYGFLLGWGLLLVLLGLFVGAAAVAHGLRRWRRAIGAASASRAPRRP